MVELPDGSALEVALAWLEAVVVNAADDADEDAAIWLLTHQSWRSEIASGYLGADNADAGHEHDVTTLDDWQQLARHAVLHMRSTLPANVQALGIGDSIGKTQFAVPQFVDRVEVVFSDYGLQPGQYDAPAGTRVGFALTAVHAVEHWTIAGVEPDWLMPAWLNELPPSGSTDGM